MNAEKAKKLLSYHSCRHMDIDSPKWANGFLGSLRPFKGELIESNFTEVMECLKALQGEFDGYTVDKEIPANIIGIIHSARAWASPDGMLGSNHLLSEAQTARLNLWTDIIEEALMWLLDGVPEEAFSSYQMYLDGEFEG